MDKNNYCVIMAGGIGSRFWPLSRTSHPKQFIDILGTGKTLIQDTYDRFTGSCLPENIYVITNSKYKSIVKEQLPLLKDHQILCEPARRNTAPAIAYATYRIAKINPDAKIIVAPSDHHIGNLDKFQNDINTALELTKSHDVLITLGIKPTRPDTGYGYIQFEKTIENGFPVNIRKIKTFTEKPELSLAVSFYESGNFLWNSGMFIWSAKSIIKAFDKHLPEISTLFKNGETIYNTPEEATFIEDIFTKSKSTSIDYGILEKADNVMVIISEFSWSDIGTWKALYEMSHKDKNRNVSCGKNIITYNTENCLIQAPKDKIVALHGLNNYIVVDTPNCLLIINKDNEQEIRQIVNDITVSKEKHFI